MANSPVYSSLSCFNRWPRLIAMQFVPGKAPRMLFDGAKPDDAEPAPYFSEMSCEVTEDQTMEFVHGLFGTDHPMMYDMTCGRPWAVVEPIHNIVVSVIKGENGIEIGFYRRQPVNHRAPTPDDTPEPN